MKDKKLMRDIARGGISEPRLTVTVGDESKEIFGESCRYFALGYLVGIEAATGNVSVDDNTIEDGKTNG